MHVAAHNAQCLHRWNALKSQYHISDMNIQHIVTYLATSCTEPMGLRWENLTAILNALSIPYAFFNVCARKFKHLWQLKSKHVHKLSVWYLITYRQYLHICIERRSFQLIHIHKRPKNEHTTLFTAYIFFQPQTWMHIHLKHRLPLISLQKLHLICLKNKLMH